MCETNSNRKCSTGIHQAAVEAGGFKGKKRKKKKRTKTPTKARQQAGVGVLMHQNNEQRSAAAVGGQTKRRHKYLDGMTATPRRQASPDATPGV